MSEQAGDEQLFAVVFDLAVETDTWPPFATEKLWAAKTSTKLQAVIRNTPFYVRGVSYGDLVVVRPDHDRRELVFDSLVQESGHSTLRILVTEKTAAGQVEEILKNQACSWEIGTTDDYLAVDIPPTTDYSLLLPKLLSLRSAGMIGLQEGAVSGIHRAQLKQAEENP